MGAWSTRIFDNDVTMDILAEYKILLGYGISPEETYRKISDYFGKDFIGKEDEDDYWLGIAYFQWRNGILLEEVKEKALRCMNDENYLERWKDSGEKVYQKRKKVLEEFMDKLLHEVRPTKKKFPKCPSYYRKKTDWKIGDLIACKMTEEPRDEQLKFYNNKYFLLRVIDIWEKPVSMIYPELDFSSQAIIMLYDWYGGELPTKDIVNNLSFKPIFHHIAQILTDKERKWLDTPYWVERVVSAIDYYEESDCQKVCEMVVLENDPRFCNETPDLWRTNPCSVSCYTSDINDRLARTFKEWGYKKEYMRSNL